MMQQRPMPGSSFRARGGAPSAGKPKFMADGGAMGAPAPIGGPAGPPMGGAPKPPAAGADPDMDGDMDSPGVRPEAVNYHDDPQSCSTCSMFQDGNCSLLRMQVSPDGGCNGFESKGDTGGDEMPEGAGGEGGEGGDTGDSGAGGGY